MWYKAWGKFPALRRRLRLGCGLLWSAWSAADGCELAVYPVQFGIYSGAAVYTQGEVIVENCASFRVALSGGLSGHDGLRFLSDGRGNRVGYGLYQDAGHSLSWGDGSQTGEVARGQGSARLMVYGRVPAGQLPPPGNYQDQVMVIVEW